MPAGACFSANAVALTKAQKKQLHTVAQSLAGKLQKIEIRGHTDRRPLAPHSPYRDHWDLAYARCRAVHDELVAQGIDPRRIRLGVAGQNEPCGTPGDPMTLGENSRVEVRLLSEWLLDPGSAPAPAPPAMHAPAAAKGR